MNYISLNNPEFKVNFKDAVLMGQAPGKGLFFPDHIPQLSKNLLANLKKLPKEEIALEVIRPFTGNCVEEEALKNIIEETIDFAFPLVRISDSVYSLELFHGPTGAFKDVGARFLSGVLQYFSEKSDRKITILVATSGDTGGAVADAFYGKENVDVFILFPSGKVSKLQETQLTCYGGNIHPIEVSGTFDDCQALVKQAFSDKTLNKKFNFISANSINIARWVSQQFYYFFAIKQWPYEIPPVISVPSGNLGNISAGLLAKRTGLDMGTFIAACNENKSLVDYLNTGIFKPEKTIPTISNAMDVGNPSNFSRVLNCLVNTGKSSELTGYSFTNEETKNAIHEVYQKENYLMDPHGAVGYLALKKFQESHSETRGIFLETAHPAKFGDTIESIIGVQPKIPKNLLKHSSTSENKVRINPSYEAFINNLA